MGEKKQGVMDVTTSLPRAERRRERYGTRYKREAAMEGRVYTLLFLCIALLVTSRLPGVCGQSTETLQCSYASSTCDMCPQELVCTQAEFFFLLPSPCQPTSPVSRYNSKVPL